LREREACAKSIAGFDATLTTTPAAAQQRFVSENFVAMMHTPEPQGATTDRRPVLDLVVIVRCTRYAVASPRPCS
jgi:hypothetical protein